MFNTFACFTVVLYAEPPYNIQTKPRNYKTIKRVAEEENVFVSVETPSFQIKFENLKEKKKNQEILK